MAYIGRRDKKSKWDIIKELMGPAMQSYQQGQYLGLRRKQMQEDAQFRRSQAARSYLSPQMVGFKSEDEMQPNIDVLVNEYGMTPEAATEMVRGMIKTPDQRYAALMESVPLGERAWMTPEAWAARVPEFFREGEGSGRRALARKPMPGVPGVTAGPALEFDQQKPLGRRVTRPDVMTELPEGARGYAPGHIDPETRNIYGEGVLPKWAMEKLPPTERPFAYGPGGETPTGGGPLEYDPQSLLGRRLTESSAQARQSIEAAIRGEAGIKADILAEEREAALSFEEKNNDRRIALESAAARARGLDDLNNQFLIATNKPLQDALTSNKKEEFLAMSPLERDEFLLRQDEMGLMVSRRASQSKEPHFRPHFDANSDQMMLMAHYSEWIPAERDESGRILPGTGRERARMTDLETAVANEIITPGEKRFLEKYPLSLDAAVSFRNPTLEVLRSFGIVPGATPTDAQRNSASEVLEGAGYDPDAVIAAVVKNEIQNGGTLPPPSVDAGVGGIGIDIGPPPPPPEGPTKKTVEELRAFASEDQWFPTDVDAEYLPEDRGSPSRQSKALLPGGSGLQTPEEQVRRRIADLLRAKDALEDQPWPVDVAKFIPKAGAAVAGLFGQGEPRPHPNESQHEFAKRQEAWESSDAKRKAQDVRAIEEKQRRMDAYDKEIARLHRMLETPKESMVFGVGR